MKQMYMYDYNYSRDYKYRSPPLPGHQCNTPYRSIITGRPGLNEYRVVSRNNHNNLILVKPIIKEHYTYKRQAAGNEYN